MSASSTSPAGTSRLHYAWVMAAITFVVQLVGAGIRATPGIMIVPWERAFGW